MTLLRAVYRSINLVSAEVLEMWRKRRVEDAHLEVDWHLRVGLEESLVFWYLSTERESCQYYVVVSNCVGGGGVLSSSDWSGVERSEAF